MKVLSINPGSTSTKIALYEDKNELFCTTLRHSIEELAPFIDIPSQCQFRKNLVIGELKSKGYDINGLAAVVGRGGLFHGIKGGGYKVNQAMVDKVFSGDMIAHASNLGSVISYEIAKEVNIPPYIYDCVSSDNKMDIARVTGLDNIERVCRAHVLNSRSVARKVAGENGKKYSDVRYIVAHLGGGVSISAHVDGEIIESLSDDEGPFSPERCGLIPVFDVMELCFSGKYTKKELSKLLRGNAGLKSLLGTSDCIEIEEMIEAGNKKAELCYRAFAYNVARGIGDMLPAILINGNIDGIILTGGIAYSNLITDWISEYVNKIAPVTIYPGENEMEALTFGALRLLSGEELAGEYK